MLGEFIYCNPTRIYFGKKALANLEKVIMKYGPKVLLVYGKGSIKKNGIYDEVMTILNKANKEVIEEYSNALQTLSSACQVHNNFIPLLETYVSPIFELLRPIPPIAWIPLSIVWFGLGEASKYFLIMYSAFCAVTMNAYSGVRSVDQELMGAARMLGANNRQVFTSIVLPSCVPQIFSGLQIAVGTSWATVVAAEMVRSSEGVGWVIIRGQDSNSTVQILVGIVAIGIVGYILAVVMRAIEARLCRWSVRGK